MTISYVLLQVVAVPALSSLLVLALGGKVGRRVGWVAFAAMAYTTALLISVGLGFFDSSAANPMVQENYVWASVAGLNFGFLADDLSLPVALMMNIICAATTIYSMGYMKHRLEVLFGKERNGSYSVYFLNILLVNTGLIGVVLSTNLIEMYLFVELILIPSAFMMALFGYENRERIAIMYFLWNHLGAFLFLAGIIVAYISTGSFAVSSLADLGAGSIAYWVVGLILVGWLVKMAVVGVHMWLPGAHAEHPTSFAPFMVTIVALGNYVIVRLLLQYMPAPFSPFAFPLMVIALATMVYGGALTTVQTDVKYVYAWSTIGQNAYTLLGIGSLSLLGVSGGLFYFLNHLIGKTILFGVAGILICQVGTRDMRKMGGLAGKMPITATLCLLGTMILSAVPPTGGFQAEWLLFTGVFFHGTSGVLGWNFVVAIFAIAATILTVGYTFWPMRRMFFGPLPAELANVKEAPLIMTAPLIALAALSIILGLYPDLFFKFLYHYATLLHLGGP